MKKIIFSLVLCIPVLLSAQNQFPGFKFGPLQITVPSEMTYLQRDSTNLVGDDFVYNLNGQVFNMNKGEGHIQTMAEGFSGKTNQKTPWKTLTELLFAYQKNDFPKVKSLFTPASQKEIDKVLKTQSDINNYMAAGSSISGIDIYCAFDHEGRITAQARIPEYDGVMPFVFEKIGQKYYMAMVTDSAAVTWNIGMHCMFNPGPMLSPKIISTPNELLTILDTLGGYTSDVGEFSFLLNNPDNYLVFFTEVGGAMHVLYSVQEGSIQDLATQPNLLLIKMNGMGMPIGELTFYAVESDYPIDLITEEAVKNAVSFKIEVILKQE